MKLATPIAAVAGALVAGAAVTFYFQSQAGDRLPAPTPLALNTSVSGELSSKSLLNYSDGVRSALYTLQAEKGQLLSVSVSGALRPQLSVMHNGALVARASNDSDDNAGAQSKTVLVFKAETAGAYQLAVSGADASAFGPFQVKVEALQGYTGEPLTPGQTITDWGLGKVQEYTLNIAEDGLYRIDMRAAKSDLDSYMTLRDAAGNDIASDDDGGNQYDARLQVALNAGRYTIVADSAMETSQFLGGYTISVERVALPSGELLRDQATLRLNAAPVTGLYAGEPMTLRFTLDEPALVTAEISAQGFSPDVELLTADGQQRGSSSGQRNRIRAVLQAGEHQLQLSGNPQSGPFGVAVKTQAVPANAGGGELRVGQPRPAVLLAGLPQDVYTLNITQPGEYALSMRAPDADSYLALYQDGNEVASDDDSGNNMDALITTSLTPGVYELHARTLGDEGRDRRYTVSAQRR